MCAPILYIFLFFSIVFFFAMLPFRVSLFRPLVDTDVSMLGQKRKGEREKKEKERERKREEYGAKRIPCPILAKT